jgi:hypothetical protein
MRFLYVYDFLTSCPVFALDGIILANLGSGSPVVEVTA